MKIYAARHAAACIAGLAFFVSSTVSAAAPVSSLPIISKERTLKFSESFSVQLKSVSNSTSVQLVIQKPAGKRVWITFKSPDGDIMDSFYTEKKAGEISRSYNFTDAEAGTYSFEITDGQRTETKTVKLESITQKVVKQLSVK